MKAKDLMIGDWVRNDFGENQQIVEIRQDCVMLAYNDTFSLGKIDPIPLTPEILEKNGFRYTNNHTLKGADTYVLRLDQRGFDFTITIKLNDYFALDSYDDRVYRLVQIETGRWSVHHLQHALLLCGIEKDIVL